MRQPDCSPNPNPNPNALRAGERCSGAPTPTPTLTLIRWAERAQDLLESEQGGPPGQAAGGSGATPCGTVALVGVSRAGAARAVEVEEAAVWAAERGFLLLDLPETEEGMGDVMGGLGTARFRPAGHPMTPRARTRHTLWHAPLNLTAHYTHGRRLCSPRRASSVRGCGGRRWRSSGYRRSSSLLVCSSRCPPPPPTPPPPTTTTCHTPHTHTSPP